MLAPLASRSRIVLQVLPWVVFGHVAHPLQMIVKAFHLPNEAQRRLHS